MKIYLLETPNTHLCTECHKKLAKLGLSWPSCVERVFLQSKLDDHVYHLNGAIIARDDQGSYPYLCESMPTLCDSRKDKDCHTLLLAEEVEAIRGFIKGAHREGLSLDELDYLCDL